MRKAGLLLGGCIGGISVLMVLTFMVSMGPSKIPAPDSPDGSQLNHSAVPLKAAVAWLIKAGAICPQISAPLLAAQLQQESGFNPKAISAQGAEGIAQFLPGTFAAIGKDDDGNGTASPYDVGDAIMAQGRYMCQIANQVKKVPGDPVADTLAGYNAGPQAVIDAGGIPTIRETQDYVRGITANIAKYSQPGTGGGGTGQAVPGSTVAAVIAAARSQIGIAYAWGGGGYSGPSRGVAQGAGTVGFDCSSLMQYAFYQGTKGQVQLPRVTDQQEASSLVKTVDWSQMQPGDMIFFRIPGEAGWGHVALYVGNGQIIEAPHTGANVRISSVTTGYYAAIPHTVRRVVVGQPGE